MPTSALAIASALTFADRKRPVHLLGLLGSEPAGEGDTATLAACGLLRQWKLARADVVVGPAGSQSAVQPFAATDWRQTVAACLRQHGGLRHRKAGSLRKRFAIGRLSAKQTAIVREIALRPGALAGGVE